MTKILKKQQENRTVNLFRKNGSILGVSVTGTQKEVLLSQIGDYLTKIGQNEAKKPLFVTTPNPEQLVMAFKNNDFRNILNYSDISLCDGLGLTITLKYLNGLKEEERKIKKTGEMGKFNHNGKIGSNASFFKKLYIFFVSYYKVLFNDRDKDKYKVIKGRDFFLDLQKFSDNNNYKVFLLGSTKKNLLSSVNVLKNDYPSVHYGHDYNLKLNEDGVPLNEKEMEKEKLIIAKINNFKPDMLFVGFGAPKQEFWVYRHLDKLRTRLVMVVGGTYDYIAGTRVKTPKFIEECGMEWLWRLVTGSQSFKRIFNAVVKYPLLVIYNS